MFKRKVEIAGLNTGGISLRVTFNVFPSTFPSLEATYKSVSGDERNELVVYSPHFRLVSEAKKWIADLTDEVMKLCALDRELTNLFKTLEGEEII